MGRKIGSCPYGYQRGNPWRNFWGRFCSRGQDLDGIPHSHIKTRKRKTCAKRGRSTRNKKPKTRNLSS